MGWGGGGRVAVGVREVYIQDRFINIETRKPDTK